MRGGKANPASEALLRCLRRLVTRASALEGTDRRQLVALLDDLTTTRRGLLRECEQIEDEMRQAAARTRAIGAYIQGSRAGRGRRSS